MTFRTLIRRSLRYHWRSHLGVVLGAAIGSAALIGALVVGDSVKGSLRERAMQRLPNVWAAMSSRDRYFLDALVGRMYAVGTNRQPQVASLPHGETLMLGFPSEAPDSLGHALIQLPASVSQLESKRRANAVTLYGLSHNTARQMFGPIELGADDIILNVSLARQLDAHTGDQLIVRVPKASAFSRENAVSTRSDASVALRLTVSRILPDNQGDLSLQPGQSTPLNAFVQRDSLAKQVGVDGQANLLLVPAALRWQQSTLMRRFEVARMLSRINPRHPSPFRDFSWLRSAGSSSGYPVSSSETAAVAEQLLAPAWMLGDADYRLKAPTLESHFIELRTPRIFLDPPVVKSALAADPDAQPLLTYLATLLRAGTNATPYSMVTAAGSPWTPVDMRDDEILVSQWLADDLRVKPGDEIAMSYFDPESGAKLIEKTNSFRVRGIVPAERPWADRTLMPDFPGIEKAESTSDWDAGFPLTYKVRPKDDEYWQKQRGTPKAFVTLAAGQKMWGNRFGNLTAIRFPIPTNLVGTLSTASQTSPPKGDSVERIPPNVEAFRVSLEKKILANLRPEELGLRFEPVRERALKAAEESQDFGGLFLGFSFFVILAALLLMAMLFQFGLEQRAPEIGTLLALGFTPKQVRKLLLREGVALAFLGGIIGVIGGLVYARAMLHGLTTVWRDAVGASALQFHFTGQSLAIGLFASVIVSAVTIWLALRKIVKRPARELLVGEIGAAESAVRSRGVIIGGAALICAVATVGWAFWSGDSNNAESFFSAGSLVLVAGLAFGSAWLIRLANGRAESIPAKLSFRSLALRGCARRRKRSLSTVAMLACGSFLIASIGVFRLDANRDATKRSSGTGGFALVGNTTMTVVQDLNTPSGREFFALNEGDLKGVSFVPFRVRAGDEASCLNLNAARQPRLLGVKPEMLEGRFAFAKNLNETTKIGPWSALTRFHLTVPLEQNEVPAIGDENSIQWAMHKKVGDTIDYVDERGQPFKVRIVGAVANSILQGQLIIDEAEFVKRFPGESGYRMFLIEAPSNNVAQVTTSLSRAMQDVGLELTPSAQRLDQFNAVQNTYLGTFQVLGGLGLLLGSAGLGIVVLRNVLERRGELAVLMAVGFRKPQVQRLLLMENGTLLAAGLALGVVAAGVAVLPALLSPGAQLPVASLVLTLGAVLLNGALWTWLATRLALRGDLLAALRNE
jgi:putative ABC transport system permease protein